MRLIFSIILILHGLIHLLGFVKAYKLAEVNALQLSISKAAGAAWLLAALLMILCALSFMLKKEAWWILAILALLLSQSLVFLAWSDAKMGTIVNIMLLIGIILSFSNRQFDKTVRKEVEQFIPTPSATSSRLSERHLSNLVPVVEKWLRRSQVLGKDFIETAYFWQTGKMRMSQDGKWTPFEAHQWIKTENPGFIWLAHVKAPLGLDIAACDHYKEGKGNMLIKLLSLYPIENASGSEIDQGAMLRYLAEMVWYPSAAIQPYIEWEELDANTAKARIKYGGRSAEALFFFDAQGNVVSVEADRFFQQKGKSSLEKWEVILEGHTDFEGVIVPARAEIHWKLSSGDYHWYKVSLKKIRYNFSELPFIPHE